MRFLDEKRKNVLRAYVAQAASVLEIIIAVLVLAAILITGVRVTGEIFGLFVAENASQAFTAVLEHAFNLIIGVEFIKMLAKHTPGSAIEVLLFTISRQLVVEHTTPVENLIGALLRHPYAGNGGCLGGDGGWWGKGRACPAARRPFGT